MKRLKIIIGISLLALITSLILFSFKKKNVDDGREKQATEKPNIIFLLTDDQRWDAMGAMGNPIIQTPNMDKLATAGVLFQNAYVTTSICCVSRASILTGQYESAHHIHDFLSLSRVSRRGLGVVIRKFYFNFISCL